MVKAKMILTFSKERAEEALNKLKEGAKFEDVVEKYSEDQGTAGEGGDLGTFEINSMFPDSEEFQTKVRKVKAGEYTDIITTEMGSYNIYKIVLVEEHISGSTIPLEDVKEDIKWFLSEEKSLLEFDKIMQKISSIKVEE
jgi:parvulin-like peptidyl-prolyl isomerase